MKKEREQIGVLQLRRFGFRAGFLFAAAGAWVFFGSVAARSPETVPQAHLLGMGIWAVGAVFLLAGLFVPTSLHFAYLPCRVIWTPICQAVWFVLAVLVFVVLLLPLGMVLRARWRRPKFSRESYWNE